MFKYDRWFMKRQERRLREDRDPLAEEERAIRLMGDEFNEAEMEAEETKDGERHDVIQEADPYGGDILPQEGTPEGMESATRGTGGDADDVRRENEDEENGSPDSSGDD